MDKSGNKTRKTIAVLHATWAVVNESMKKEKNHQKGSEFVKVIQKTLFVLFC